jgi:hypothetical protein
MTESAIRWRVIRAGAPVGLKDIVLAEFTAPDKREAREKLEARITAGEFPADAIVVSARVRAKEIRRQERLKRSANYRGRRRA